MGLFRREHHTCSVKVCQFDIPAFVEENILRFDIHMYQVCFVVHIPIHTEMFTKACTYTYQQAYGQHIRKYMVVRLC